MRFLGMLIATRAYNHLEDLADTARIVLAFALKAPKGEPVRHTAPAGQLPKASYRGHVK